MEDLILLIRDLTEKSSMTEEQKVELIEDFIFRLYRDIVARLGDEAVKAAEGEFKRIADQNLKMEDMLIEIEAFIKKHSAGEDLEDITKRMIKSNLARTMLGLLESGQVKDEDVITLLKSYQ